jgi:hypothetical protein
MTIAYAASIAAAVLASGCVVVDDGIDPGDPLDAQFFVTWETVGAISALEIDCIWAGANTVRTSAVNVTTGDEFVDLFDCRDKGGSTYPVNAGKYWVTVDLLWCDNDACIAPVVISPASTVGPYSMFRHADVDLGHFVFLVDGL